MCPYSLIHIQKKGFRSRVLAKNRKHEDLSAPIAWLLKMPLTERYESPTSFRPTLKLFHQYARLIPDPKVPMLSNVVTRTKSRQYLPQYTKQPAVLP
mmetsp:Transcript_7222/g.17610  ORF Transcript_7222/g.17610 Transcript_7222/m.17610 type:complete len:97 (+) Transcript_7222:860-1150(+)